MGCFAALMNAGIGMYAPAMALCALMGLNLSYAFPLAAGGCCAMMPTAGIRSITAKAIDIKVAMWMFIGSVPGVLIAALIVKSMPLTALAGYLRTPLHFLLPGPGCKKESGRRRP